mgnify:FL=1
MRILAVVPAYNEEACIASTITELCQVAPQVDYIIINDGSSDRTLDICKERGFNYLNLPANGGLSAGFRTGMRYAKEHGYDAVVQFDSDGQHRPEYIAPMAQAMVEEEANIVIASRFVTKARRNSPREIGSKLISWLIKSSTGQTITDPTSGMRMYDRGLIETYARSFDFSPEPDTISLLMRRGAKVVEIETEMRERQGGKSYLGFYNSIMYMARTCLSLLLFQWFR